MFLHASKKVDIFINYPIICQASLTRDVAAYFLFYILLTGEPKSKKKKITS